MQTAAGLAELMRLVARQDRAAFQALYEATSAKLYGVAFRILGRRDLADEALQDSYIRIWNRAGDFDPARASPITWMVAIVRNRSLDEARRTGMVSLADMPPNFDPADDRPDPLQAGQHAERLRSLLACLKTLDAKHRSLVLLAYYHGASREALASRFDAPVATIKTWLHRSLARLRACLAA